MKLLSDGNIEFEPQEQLIELRIYQQDPNNPLRFVPKFDKPCTARKFTGGISPCAKFVKFDWRCTKFNKGTSISICAKCMEPELP